MLLIEFEGQNSFLKFGYANFFILQTYILRRSLIYWWHEQNNCKGLRLIYKQFCQRLGDMPKMTPEENCQNGFLAKQINHVHIDRLSCNREGLPELPGSNPLLVFDTWLRGV